MAWHGVRGVASTLFWVLFSSRFFFFLIPQPFEHSFVTSFLFVEQNWRRTRNLVDVSRVVIIFVHGEEKAWL